MNDIDSGAGSPSTASNAAASLILTQYVRGADDMKALHARFQRYREGMDFDAFEKTLIECFPSLPHTVKVTPPDAEVGSSTPASSPKAGSTRAETPALPIRLRRQLARLELAGAVVTDPLRLLFRRIDKANDGTVTWDDVLAYMVTEAASAGVLSSVRDDYRPYTASRIRRSRPMPETPATGMTSVKDISAAALNSSDPAVTAAALAGDPDRLAAISRAKQAELHERQRVLRNVWRGQQNKYGGKHIPGAAAAAAASMATGDEPREGVVYESSDLAFVEFLDALPTNPIAFAVCGRYRPLSLYSKTTFDLLRCFTDAELGNVQPSKVAYIASSDTLLVYSAVDGQIRSFTGLFQSPQVSTLTPYVVTAGLLQCMRQVPVEHPDCVFIAGSHGSIHQLRIPNRYNTEADNSDNELSLSDRTRREISVVREFDKIHDRVEGGITDFVMSATHFFSCGFDRKLISTSIATGVSTVIGLPDEAIRCLGYNDAFNAILAVSFTTGALSLWDARATGVVQGSKFEGGGTTTGEDQPEGMQDNGGEEQRCLHIIGIECPADMPHAITADADGAIRVWDLRSRTCLQKVSADGTGDESELTEPDSVYGRGGRVENRLRQSANPLTGGSGRRSAKGSRNTSAGESVRVGSASRGFDLSTKIEEPKYSSLSNSTGTAASMGSITRKSSPGRFSVLRSLAYFGATREIVTCTADTVYTLRHNQRRNDALCDLDLTLDVVHIVRGVGGRQQSQAFGQFLLRGPSRLSLWDVEHGFRTRHVDRALIPALPASRQEVVAFSVDDVTNRVFLSFPDGALEVHNLEDVFDVDLTGRDVPFEGSVIIAGKGASVSAGWEVVTELKYLGDHQLLLGLTSQGRLLLYSEATNDNYLNYISPSPGSTVYLSNLSSSDEVELCAFTAGDEAVAGGDGTTQTGSGKKGSRIFIHHYRRVGGDFAASTQLTLNRPVTQLLFLERLPLLLSAHSYGDVTLWSCPPVKPNFVPVATLNVFSAGPHRVPLQFQAETIQQLHSPLNKSPPKEVRGGGGGGGDSNGSSTTAQPAHGKKESSPSDKPAKDGLPPLASSMTTRSRSRVVSVVNVERPSVLRASLTQQHDNVNAEESQYARTCSSETTMYTLPEILGGGSLRPETEKAGGVPPDDSGLRLVDGSGDREVTAVTFDGRSHTLFFGDSDGSLHFYSLCPTIQLYGLRPCRFECRAQYPARTLPSSPNASESARPLFLTRCVAHDGVSSTIGSSPAVIALAWLPFLNVLVSSGEDRTVVLFNRHAERLGNLSAAQLPPETAVSSKDNSPLRGNNGSRAPYVLPQRTAVDRTQFINDFFGASDEQDACKKNGCELVSSAAAICVPVEPSKYSSPIPTCKLSSEAAVSHKSSSVKPRYPLAEDLRGALQENPKYSASIRPGTAGTRPGTGPSLRTPASPNRETGVTKKGTRDGGTSELRSTEVAGGAGSRTSYWSDSLPTNVLRAVPGKKPASDLLARQAPGSATWPRPVFASDDPEYVEMISVNPTMASLVDRNREEEAASMRTKMSGTRKEAVDTSDPCVPLFRAPPVVELTGPNSLVVDIVPEVQLMAAREPSADTVVTAVTDEVPTALSLSRAQTPVAFVEEALTPQLVPSREPSPRLPAQYVTEVDREPIHSEELGFHAAITGHCALPQPPHTQPCTNTRGLKSTRHHRGDNDGIGGGDSGKLRRGCTCRSPVPPSFVRKQKETLTWRATNTAASPPREKKRTPRPLPGTSEALDIRVNVYGGELKRCLKARSLGKPAPGMETPWSCATDDAASQRAL